MAGEALRVGRLLDRLQSSLSGVTLNGSMSARLPHNLNVTVDGVNGEQLLMGLGDVAVSSGAACTSNSGEPSHVLRALGLDDKRARASVRFGLGRFNNETEVDQVVEIFQSLVKRLRAPAQVFELEHDDRDLPPEWQ